MAERDRLISKNYNSSTKHKADILHQLMFNVEEALISAGAKPSEDYNYKDLMGYAIQLFDSDEYEVLRME